VQKCQVDFVCDELICVQKAIFDMNASLLLVMYYSTYII